MKTLFFPMILVLTLASSAIAEVKTISCPAEAPIVRRLQIQEQWRIDGDDPESPVIGYFYPSQIFAHDGRVYMLDGQLCDMLVYSDDGEYIDTILGEGDGPGEVRRPGSMFRCTDDRIAVKYGYPTKLKFVELDGTPSGEWSLQANAFALRIQETDLGWFGIYTESKETDDPNVFSSIMRVALHDNEGERTQEYYSEVLENRHYDNHVSDEVDDHKPWFSAVAVSGGQIVLAAERDEYRLEWRNLNGELTRIVTRDYPAHQRTEDEMDTLKYRSYSISNGDLQFKKVKLSSYDPTIARIEPLADGRLRIITSLYAKELSANMVCRYELHGANGALLESVEIYDPTGDFDPDYDSVSLLDNGRVMILRNVLSASRAAIDSRLHPDVLAKLPPIPDDREDIAFTPVMCDLVPFEEIGEGAQ